MGVLIVVVVAAAWAVFCKVIEADDFVTYGGSVAIGLTVGRLV